MTEILQSSDSIEGGLTFWAGLFLAVVVTLTFLLPRRLAMLPLLATVCYMPIGREGIVIGAFHFPIPRLLILCGMLRILCRGEFRFLARNRIDILFYWWAFSSLVLGSLATPAMFINRLGAFYNEVGVFLLASCWVRDVKTFVGLVKALAVFVIPIAILMVVEKFTTRNVFFIFGGVPEFTGVREGHLRCQAAFRHPILAGTFGATLLPLFVGLWFQGQRGKRLALAGAIGAGTIALAAASSGPFLTILLGALGFACWKLRDRMRMVRRSILVAIVILAMFMNAPVWYIFARLSSVSGGTGWHRAWLIDQTLAHFGDWWLVGTSHTAEWAPSQVLPDDPNNIDITNQYIGEGLRGGLLELALFLAIIVSCFKAIGRRIHAEGDESFPSSILFWAIGVSLFTHCMSFMSVTYFDQIAIIWFWLLAVISRIICNDGEIYLERSHIWEPVLICSQNTEGPEQPPREVFP